MSRGILRYSRKRDKWLNPTDCRYCHVHLQYVIHIVIQSEMHAHVHTNMNIYKYKFKWKRAVTKKNTLCLQITRTAINIIVPVWGVFVVFGAIWSFVSASVYRRLHAPFLCSLLLRYYFNTSTSGQKLFRIKSSTSKKKKRSSRNFENEG